jgi:RNA polymerase sigma-70 factor (ECF subfamily)
MTADEAAIAIFRAERDRLYGLAFRLLGSAAEAEDALQDAWVKLDSVEAETLRNLPAWLTTVVSRIALDMLRSRRTRRESASSSGIEAVPETRNHANPEQEVMLAESIGIALLVVLDRLAPAERLAFVLHDLFALPFAEVAHILGRSPDAARQLASRGRRRVRGSSADMPPRCGRQDRAVAAFYAASRCGDFERLVALLDPNAELVIDATLSPSAREQIVRGPVAIAHRAKLGATRAQEAGLAYVDGHAGIGVAEGGQLRLLMLFKMSGERISRIEIVTDPSRLSTFEIGLGPWNTPGPFE